MNVRQDVELFKLGICGVVNVCIASSSLPQASMRAGTLAQTRGVMTSRQPAETRCRDLGIFFGAVLHTSPQSH